jgi:alcohol dehydrogenase class IV
MSFDFATAARIIFGNGKIVQLGDLGKECGTRPFILTGSGKSDPEKIFNLIRNIPQDFTEWKVTGEPTIADIENAVALARREKCDYVIGYGGGSVLDSGKAVAIMLTNPGEILDYLEGVGRNQPLTRPAVPCVAIPTTAGTGSEVTRNAVLTVPEKHVKVSMRSPLMLPRIALVDPLLTCTLPADVTAYTGMDALTQVLEPFVSIKSNELTDMLCREGIRRAARSLKHAFVDGNDPQAREDMSFTSLLGGLSLANAGLGMVHGFAGVIGGMFNAHHGAICASLLPAVMEINVNALKEREPDSPKIARYDEIARIFSMEGLPKISIAWTYLQELSEDLKIPRLREMGIAKNDFEAIIAASQKASSTKGNPIVLTTWELRRILDMAY